MDIKSFTKQNLYILTIQLYNLITRHIDNETTTN